MNYFNNRFAFRSLAFKTAIIYFAIFLTGLSLVGMLMLRYSSENIIDSAESNIQHSAELIKIKIDEYLTGLESDVHYLSSSPLLEQYILDPTADNASLLAKNYLALIESKIDYAQIRFISNDSEGSEVIRVDRDSLTCFIVPQERLQFKGDRPYYFKTIELSKGDIYFSEIDLNKEFGRISLPRTPTLRVAKPIYIKNKLQGVIVINTNLTRLFETLSNTVKTDYSLRLLNHLGYYLMHENVDSTFVFETPNERRPKAQFDLNKLGSNNQGLIELAGEQVIAYNKVFHENVHEELIYFVMADKNQVLKTYKTWRKNSLIIILVIGLLFTLVAFFVSTKQSKTLLQIADRLREFPINREIKNLPIHREDEIGDLAKSLSEMAGIINSQIDKINKEKQKAEKAVKQKSEFIENISHEIRNPLQSIMGLSNMLENNKPNPNQLELLNSLKFNTTNLLGLVNNILDYQNVIKGNIHINRSWTKLPQLVNELIMGNKYGAVQKGITIKPVFEELFNTIEVNVDRLRLSQVLNNLIANAIKFTPSDGYVTVELKQLDVVENKLKIAFSVEDTGIGMSESDIEKIKERYFTNKGVQTLTSNFGLGLTIVNELLSYFDSSLNVNSTLDKGSKFYFNLLLDYREQVDKKAEEAGLDLYGLDIVIIEDDDQILNLYRYLLRDSRAKVEFLSDFEFLDPAKKYDLVISDYRFSKRTLLQEESTLYKILKEDSCLIIASAIAPDMTMFKNQFKHITFMRKPFTVLEFNETVFKAVITAKYGFPNVEPIKKDYDHQKEKYTYALGLLLNEWEGITQKLVISISESDLTLMESTLHKFVTTLKRLELDAFDELLEDIKDQIKSESIDKVGTIKFIKRALDVYAKIIRDNT